MHTIDDVKVEISQLLSNKKSMFMISQAIDTIIGHENFSSENFQEFIKERLLKNNDNSQELMKELLNIKIDVLVRWYKFVKGIYEEDVIYHTFHGTKGLEYDNVIMIFGDSFGKNKNFFDLFFQEYGKIVDEEKKRTFNVARNLLYVAVTRAKRHLRILYTGNYQNNAVEINKIFEGIKEWRSE